MTKGLDFFIQSLVSTSAINHNSVAFDCARPVSSALSLLSVNLHNLSGAQEAAMAGWDSINEQVKGRRWLIHEAVCKESLSRVISRLSACAHTAMGVGQCCVSWWVFHKQDPSVLLRHLSHKEGRRVGNVVCLFECPRVSAKALMIIWNSAWFFLDFLTPSDLSGYKSVDCSCAAAEASPDVTPWTPEL